MPLNHLSGSAPCPHCGNTQFPNMRYERLAFIREVEGTTETQPLHPLRSGTAVTRTAPKRYTVSESRDTLICRKCGEEVTTV